MCVIQETTVVPVLLVTFSHCFNFADDGAFDHPLDCFSQVVCFVDNLLTLAIDNFTLLTHDFVIFQDVLTCIVVVPFDAFLRRFYLAGEETAGNRHIFHLFIRHIETFPHGFDSVRTETTHEVIF